MGGVTSRTIRTTSLLCKKKEAAVLQESTGQDIYFSMADIIDFIDSEYNVVCRKTLVPWAPRHDNTASLPSRTGTKDSELNISPLIISSFSCLKMQKKKEKINGKSSTKEQISCAVMRSVCCFKFFFVH